MSLKPIFHQALTLLSHWQLRPTQINLRCTANDSSYMHFNQNEVDLWSCMMIMQTAFKNVILLLVNKIFEILPSQNLLRNLPKQDQKTPGGI